MEIPKTDPAEIAGPPTPEKHLTSKVLMIRPVRFGFNEETAVNNAFQKKGGGEVQGRALEEFDAFVALLRAAGVEVLAVEDTPEPHTPDSIFPNNWFSTHSTGELVLYPMCAPNRRTERKEAPLAAVRALGPKGVPARELDLTGWEAKGLFLEGTGSMVLDRAAKTAFVCRSPRSDETVLAQFAHYLGYTYHYFDAQDRAGGQIYHTNVMMCVGDAFVVACLDSIRDAAQRQGFVENVRKHGKELVDITMDQMERFAGNMLQLKGRAGGSVLAMSLTAKNSLRPDQLDVLEKHSAIIAPDISTIEANGGGSARCMLAELFF